jgi:hypothetical protein
MTLVQFTGMKTTPFQIIAAQGANTIIIPISFGLELVLTGTAFTNGGVGGLQFGNTASFPAGANRIVEFAASDITTPTVKTMLNPPMGLVTSVGYPTMHSYTESTSVNTGVFISNATAAFATGTGATIVVNVVYTVLTTS